MKLKNLNELRPVKIRVNPKDSESSWNIYRAWFDSKTYIEVCQVISSGETSYATLVGTRESREVSFKLENKDEVLKWIEAMMYVVPVDDTNYNLKAEQQLKQDFVYYLEG